MEQDTDLPVGGFLTETDNRYAFVVTPRGWGCIRRGPICGSFVEEDGLVAFCLPDCSYPSSSVALEDSSKMAHVVVQPQPNVEGWRWQLEPKLDHREEPNPAQSRDRLWWSPPIVSFLLQRGRIREPFRRNKRDSMIDSHAATQPSVYSSPNPSNDMSLAVMSENRLRRLVWIRHPFGS